MSDSSAQASATQPPAKHVVAPHPRRRFYGRRDLIAAGIAAAVALAGYVYTLAPIVTLEDSGEFLTAARHLGVPHPPGYPIWTMLAWVWQWIFPFGNIAWRVNLMSASFSALAAGLATLLVSKGGHVIIAEIGFLRDSANQRIEDTFITAGSISAGLMLAFCPVMWSQAVITEVYGLNAFFLMATLAVLYRWSFETERRWRLYLAAFLWGVGLTSHQTQVLLVVAFPTFVWFADRRLGRDTLIPILLVILIGAIKQLGGFWHTISLLQEQAGQMPNQPSPWNVWFFPVVVVLVIAIGAAAWLCSFWRREGRQTIIAGALVLAALALLAAGILYLSWKNDSLLLWMLEVFSHGISGRILRISSLTTIATLMIALGLGCAGGAVASLYVQWKWNPADVTNWKPVLGQYGAVILGLALYGYMPLSSTTNPPMNWGYARIPEGFVHQFTRGQYEKVRLERTLRQFGGQLNMFRDDVRSQFNAVFALFALVGWLFFRDLAQRDRNWLKFLLIAFACLGVGFIFLSNPTFEKQKQFTDRVFFLPAHCIYSLWIGYGLILGLSYLFHRLPRMQPAANLAAIAVLALPLVSVASNWSDNEQRRHDFGYRFGYLMFKPGGDYPEMERDAVLYGGTDPGRFVPTYMIFVESQVPTRAKTHMPDKYLASASFDRRDVYIITQNALADATYMSYIRDHYDYSRPDPDSPKSLENRSGWQCALLKQAWVPLGRDRAYPKEPIWIPSERDTQLAFQKYVDELRARTAGAGEDVRVEGGRVSVQGVAGVMAINGHLAKMIFDHNKDKHAFYVEESYPIGWMYPFLEPYGIIMRINKEPLRSPQEDPALWEQIITRDRSYWDRLCLDLKSDPRFNRDDVAQKTFSKLRSAIGGVYAFRKSYPEAEHAFQQAVQLCPDSPEANFRLAQLYLEQEKFDDAASVMERYQKLDPNNPRISDAVKQIRNVQRQIEEIGDLEQQYVAQPDNLQVALRLVEVYARRQRLDAMDAVVDALLAREDLPAGEILRVANFYAQLNQLDRVHRLLTVYVQRAPGNPLGWYNLATVNATRNNCPESIVALQKAFALDSPDGQLRAKAQQDPLLNNCRSDPQFPQPYAQPVRRVPFTVTR